MIDVTLYHWVWYFIGFIFVPRLTVMILATIYFRNILPISFLIWGWIIAIAANAVEMDYVSGKKKQNGS
jgi:energy-coupling factor transporter transmembrane protein EcfT